jgi:UDP-N-acetylmuramoyl-tripeptide--D-alanyl-D-alanine ligase
VIIAEGKPHGDDDRALLWYRGIRFRVNHGMTSVPFELMGVIGEPHIVAVLAGSSVALARGENLAAVAARFRTHESPPGRMRLLDGISGTTIIDDSYNSSPAAALKALDALAKLPIKGRRIACIGDMRELGVRSAEAHAAVGRRAAEVADILITVGEESRMLAEAAHDAGMKGNVKSYGYGESKRAGQELASDLRPGDVVLVKGSQNMIRMERLVKEIMAEPNRARELLVRQEKEWLEKL